jgi:NitT/TauT family transport system substrate-binding protein
MKRSGVILSILVLVVAAAALAYFCRTPNPEKPGASNTPATQVTVAQVGDFFLYLPLYYAKDRGFFSREGLDVSLVASGGDEKSVAAVVSGSADFGVGDPTFAAIANEQGQNVSVVGTVVNGVPFWGVTKRRDLPEVLTPAQLRGLTVATFPKPSTAYVLQEAMFKEGGIQPKIREAQFGSLLPLLDTGAVDIVLELEPNVSTAVSKGGRVVYSMAEKYPDFAITGVTTLRRTIVERPDVVRRFVRALDAAERAAHSNPADLIAFAKGRFPDVSPDIAEAAARRMLASNVLPNSARTSVSGWRRAVDLRAQSGDLKDPAASVKAVDNQFVP